MDDEVPVDPRPGMVVFPDHGVDVPVWRIGGGGLVDAGTLVGLGVSPQLVERLRAWQDGWDHDPFGMTLPREREEGTPPFLRLARQLQRDLPGHRVHIRGRSGPIPIDEWPG